MIKVNRIQIKDYGIIKELDIPIKKHLILVGPPLQGQGLIVGLLKSMFRGLNENKVIDKPLHPEHERRLHLTCTDAVTGYNYLFKGELHMVANDNVKLGACANIIHSFGLGGDLYPSDMLNTLPHEIANEGFKELKSKFPHLVTKGGFDYGGMEHQSGWWQFVHDLKRREPIVFYDTSTLNFGYDNQESMVEYLFGRDQQIIVATNNMLLLNYLDDGDARDWVHFTYLNKVGEVMVTPFFDIPRIKKKLELMGPGDAFVDTDHVALAKELNEL